MSSWGPFHIAGLILNSELIYAETGFTTGDFSLFNQHRVVSPGVKRMHHGCKKTTLMEPRFDELAAEEKKGRKSTRQCSRGGAAG